MRNLNDPKIEKYRNVAFEREVWGASTPEMRELGGVFFVPTKGSRRGLKVIVSTGKAPGSQGWDHVSVSLPNRCPDWGEMCMIKDLFFHPDEVCFQLHPAKSDNVSNHNYCLHIWRNINQDPPLPPAGMVGNAKLGSFKEGDMNVDLIREQQNLALAKMG